MLKNLFQKQSFREYIEENKILSQEQLNKFYANRDESISEISDFSKSFPGVAAIRDAIIKFSEAEAVNLLELPKIHPDILNEIPRNIINNEHIFAFSYGDSRDTLKVATADPSNVELEESLRLRVGKNIVLYYASWDDIDQIISRYFGTADALEAVSEYKKTLALVEDSANQLDYGLNTTDSPIVTIVNSLLDQAAKMKTSDIHIEPFEDALKIRYRIDGALVPRPSFPIEMKDAIIARLKIIGGMDISEKRIPQDGRITHIVDNVEYDIRASILPTVYGEKCVMRLAKRSNLQRDKKQLGLSEYDLKIFDKIFQNPHGIILVTGPTGSGKSTTLYTALSELSTDEVNVITVEDPVEANVDGVNQVQTNVKAGLTFASALRSILRQDPDIIMIGEIRDQETAEIAVQAAITGHLVVSTLHTNSSAATVTRLVNMGLQPYLVADSVVGVLAQRLVRRLCPRCKKEKIATEADLKDLGIKAGTKVKIYEKCGCSYCNDTGYQGRIAVYEIMDINPEIKDMIIKNASTSDIKRVAVKNGMHTLHRSAAEQVLRGVTTISEMKKVSSES